MDSRNESDSQSTPPKKSKKHKQRSPKIPLQEDDSTGDLIIAEDVSTTSSSSSSKNKMSIKVQSSTAVINKKRKKRDSATSSDEERWLSAIESGKLEDVDDELKKIKPKDPSLMTARQRAMYDRGDGNISVSTPALISLPTGYKEKVMTAEAIQKAAIKSQKRKQLADEKREKDKKKTMERLLKKQETKSSKMIKPKLTKSSVPTIIYTQNIDRATITFPPSIEYPLKSQKVFYPKVNYCGMQCGNVKKYNCSQTGIPLCSLACYKKNIANRIL